MSLGDWSQSIGNSSQITVSLEIATPIVGNGSLKIRNTGTPTGCANLFLTSLPKGFAKGRIRTLLQWQVRPSHAAYERAGIAFMQSALHITSGTPSFYTFALGAKSGYPGTLHWLINKHVNTSLQSTGPTVINESNSVTVADGDYWPIQVEWNADVSNIGGTRLTCSVGTKNSTDFGTLAVLLDTIDTSSPIVTSVAEGLFDTHPAVGFTDHTACWDSTTIYQLS